MKKISLLVTLASCLTFQAYSQVTAPAALSNGNTESKTSVSALTLTNSNGIQTNATNNLKNGGNPSSMVSFVDDFSQPNDTNGLKARGYIPYYRGTGPMGVTGTWFQGDIAIFPDFNNGSGEFVVSDFESVTGTNDIDNWLVLPALDVAVGDVMSFYSRSVLGSTYPDSIRVMYSAVGDSTPEATTWVQLGNFKVNTLGSWLQDQFIAPTAGTTARFAIRYAVVNGGPLGANSFRIGIDQLEVSTPSAFDIQAENTAAINTEYTMIPLDQATGSVLSASIKNTGLNASSGGTALFEVYDTVSTAVVFTETVNLPNINPGASAIVNTTGTYTPAATGFLSTRVTVSYPGDGNASNDIAQSAPTAFTDSIFARDNNTTSGSLGIGAGPGAGGIVGQSFTLTNPSDLTSVSFFLTDNMSPNPAGTPVYATIHTQPVGSTPDNAEIATTTTVNITPGSIAVGGQWYTLPLNGPSIALGAGQYYVGLHEADSTLTLGTTTQIVTPGTVWVTWNTIPTPPAVNGWALAEDFNFNVTYNLRLNFGTPTGINEVDANSLINVYPSPATSELYVNLDKTISNAQVSVYNSLGMLINSISNVNGSLKLDVTKFAKGVYTVKVTGNGNEYTQRFTVVK